MDKVHNTNVHVWLGGLGYPQLYITYGKSAILVPSNCRTKLLGFKRGDFTNYHKATCTKKSDYHPPQKFLGGLYLDL